MTGLPRNAIPLPPGRARVLVAVCTVPRPTVRSVSLAAGLSYGAGYRQLRILRHLGFVTWETDRAGTLRPTHRLVAVPQPLHSDGPGPVSSGDTPPPTEGNNQ